MNIRLTSRRRRGVVRYAEGARPVTQIEALGAWGTYDRDNPFPTYSEVREHGPVHQVTLADGHGAWLVVGYDEARRALNDPRLSKDMLAAMDSGDGVVAEGLPGRAFARHMLSVDPPDHSRLRGLVSKAFTTRRVEELRPQVQALVDSRLDDIAAQGPDARVDLVASYAFPLPFMVICELLGVPDEDRDALGRGLTALLMPTTTPEEHARAKVASDLVVGMLEDLVAAKQRMPGDDLVSGLINARDGDERLSTQELLSTIFQLIVAGTTPQRASSATPWWRCGRIPTSSPRSAPTRMRCLPLSRSCFGTTPRCRTRRSATRSPTCSWAT